MVSRSCRDTITYCYQQCTRLQQARLLAQPGQRAARNRAIGMYMLEIILCSGRVLVFRVTCMRGP